MKRPRIYKPRSGIRFDNRRGHDPAGGFVGVELDEVVVITGSVLPAIVSRDDRYDDPHLPIAGYPRTSDQLSSLVGGTWVLGYLCDDFSGSLQPVFGSTTLDPTGSVEYGRLGPRGEKAGDYAVEFDGADTTNFFTTSSVDLVDDLAVLFVGRVTDNGSINTGYAASCEGFNVGWYLSMGTNFGIFFNAGPSSSTSVGVAGGLTDEDIGSWFVCLAVADRTSGKFAIGTRNLDTGRTVTGSTSISGLDGYQNGDQFTFGGRLGLGGAPEGFECAALYIASGTNVVPNMAPNISSALESFANSLFSTGKVVSSGDRVVEKSIGTFGHTAETNQLNSLLLGGGTGGAGRTFKSVTAARTGSIPSWTNRHLGSNQASAFVMTTLSASDHETQVLNAYKSGSETLENTAVSDRSSLYYSKNSKYKKIIVKRSASLADLEPGSDDYFYLDWVTNTDSKYPGCATFVPGTGTLCKLTGSFNAFGPSTPKILSASVHHPAVFMLDVPVNGKLVDIKVWVEIVHPSASLGSLIGTTRVEQLGYLGLALRSPNVKFDDGNPIKNDPLFSKWKSIVGDATGLDNRFEPYNLLGTTTRNRFHTNTFILWEGAFIFSSEGGSDWRPDVVRGRYSSFNTDRSMRVVFHDAAGTPNPRHLTSTSISGNYLGAPNQAFGLASAWGCDVPWTSDSSMQEALSGPGSPPNGWLTGPGGTNAVNEWPTTGSNYGATEIRPFYPLLDDIFEVKEVFAPDSTPALGDANAKYGDGPLGPGGLFIDASDWRGFRPGLRGTEISGTWRLIVANGNSIVTNGSGQGGDVYFRQARLEITYEDGLETNLRAQAKSSPVPSGPRLLCRISGTDSISVFDSFPDPSLYGYGPGQNYLVNRVYSFGTRDSEIGRTFGVILNTGSIDQNNSALIYRLSGTLADVSGSAPSWLLDNQFGMPQIPLSSASISPTETEAVIMQPHDILSIRPILDGARRLADAARDASAPSTMIKRFDAALSGTSS